MTYILDEDGEPRAVPLLEWARWFEGGARMLARTTFTSGASVSTVFLGIDHRFAGEAPPILWESMLFDEAGGADETARYASTAEAIAGHQAMVQACVARGLAPREQFTSMFWRRRTN